MCVCVREGGGGENGRKGGREGGREEREGGKKGGREGSKEKEKGIMGEEKGITDSYPLWRKTSNIVEAMLWNLS